jgi:hypothetical protein
MLISGYQGSGKSTYAKAHSEDCVDFESSNFDKSKADWFVDYVKQAVALDDKYQGSKIIFISSHACVRNCALAWNHHGYWTVAPTKECKELLLKILANRYAATMLPKDFRALYGAFNFFDAEIDAIYNDKRFNVWWLNPNHMHITDDDIAWMRISCAPCQSEKKKEGK